MYHYGHNVLKQTKLMLSEANKIKRCLYMAGRCKKTSSTTEALLWKRIQILFLSRWIHSCEASHILEWTVFSSNLYLKESSLKSWKCSFHILCGGSVKNFKILVILYWFGSKVIKNKKSWSCVVSIHTILLAYISITKYCWLWRCFRSAPQSKHTVSAFQIICRVLSFVLENF